MRAIIFIICAIAAVASQGITQNDINDLLQAVPLSQLTTQCHSFDGVGNNKNFPLYGSNGQQLRRASPPAYVDGLEEPPRHAISARAVSNEVFSQAKSIPDPLCGSDWVWQWGQFMDHDLDLAPETHEELPIPVPPHETFFVSQATLGFGRSVPADTEPVFLSPPREQINVVSSFIDGSMVYGSNAFRALALRTGVSGTLKTSDAGRLLPLNFDAVQGFFHNAQPGKEPANRFFLCGDIRCNEQIGLAAVHTLFVREHNRLAKLIVSANSNLNDEQIYQLARKINIAQIQAITYNEWLPFLLGKKFPFQAYDPTCDATILNEFATAAFRFGHSMLSANLQLRDASGNIKLIALRDAFFLGDSLTHQDIDAISRGLAHQNAQAVDAKVVDDVRNFLFGDKTTQDLISLNIQRGRDHGLPDYNTMREAFGLRRKNSFSEITSDVVLQGKLAKVYHNNVDIIDPFAGILAEDPLVSTTGISHLGELGTTILTKQFDKLQHCDSCYYENIFPAAVVSKIGNLKLSGVINANIFVGTAATGQVQADVFINNIACPTRGP